MKTMAGKKAAAEAEIVNGDESQEKSRELAMFSTAALPGEFAGELEGLTGLGYSERAEDSLIPILSILQDNSAEVKARHEKHIDGVVAGMLMIRALKRVIDVDLDHKGQELIFQPCGFQHVYTRWRGEPGEGQVTGRYPFDDRPKEAVEKALKEDDDRLTWVMPDGDRLVDTREHYGHAYIDGNWLPIVAPFAGTNHTVSRGWTTQLKLLRLPNGARAPSWFRAYGITTHFNSRGSKSWFTYELHDKGWIADKDLRDQGRKLFESVEKQVVEPDLERENDKDETGGGLKKDDIPI